MTPETKFYVISQTHWDREWRFPFERTRAMLVEMMDRLLRLFETRPDFKHFHLDAHTIPLEDYLAVKPENRPVLEKHVREGRLLVGPWYTLPDSCSVSGEALVRNLLRGHKQAMEFGRVMKVGYTPNGFGQPSQLPQLYAGFGIDSVLFYRGVDRSKVRSEFIWEGPDGTRALAFRFGVYARYNFFFLVYRPTVHDRKAFECEYRWEQGGLPFHLCRDLSYEPYYLLDFKPVFDTGKIVPGLEEMLKVDAANFTTPLVAAMQGCDSTAPDEVEADIIAEANKVLGAGKVVHATLDQYVDDVRQAVRGQQLDVAHGEMRHTLKGGGQTNLYPDIYGTRVYLRQANAAAEVNLEDIAEPAAAVAALLGEEYPQGLLDLAWKLQMENHAHDSIGGCAMDRVHDDVMNRFARADDISHEVARMSLAKIVGHVDTTSLPANSLCLFVFNTLPYARSEVVSAMVDVPKDTPAEGIEIADAAGKKTAVQILRTETLHPTVQKPNDIPSPYHAKRFHVQFAAKDIPALGYRVFVAKPLAAPAKSGKRLSPKNNVLENEHLCATVNADGTIDLKDKHTGNLYAGLNAFEDGGEVGDPWVRMTPTADEIISSRGGKARVRRIENGGLVASIAIDVTMKLPVGVTADRAKRADKRVPFVLRSVITLSRDSRLLDVTTTFENGVKDHRLRVLFPTFLSASHSHGHMQFDVVKRPIELPDAAGWLEAPTGLCPQKWFVDVSDGAAGLAVLDQGITQYEVLHQPQTPIAFTLMRCFQMRNSVQNIDYPDQPGSQCPGRHVFRYALYPHVGDYATGGVMAEAYRWQARPQVAQIGTGKGAVGMGGLGKESLGLSESFLELSPDQLAFSGIKPAEDGQGMVVRFYNPTESAITGRLRARSVIRHASELRLDETPIVALPVQDGHSVEITAGPKKIITVKLEM